MLLFLTLPWVGLGCVTVVFPNLTHLLFVHTQVILKGNSIQLMHSFEVNIRICQPENSDVHRGEAEVNITFEG